MNNRETFYDAFAMFEAAYDKAYEAISKNIANAKVSVDKEFRIARLSSKKKRLIFAIGEDVFKKYKEGKQPIADNDTLKELSNVMEELEKETSSSEPKAKEFTID